MKDHDYNYKKYRLFMWLRNKNRDCDVIAFTGDFERQTVGGWGWTARLNWKQEDEEEGEKGGGEEEGGHSWDAQNTLPNKANSSAAVLFCFHMIILLLL